jgi:citrate lyase beta subunit
MKSTLTDLQLEGYVAMLQSHLLPSDRPTVATSGRLQPVHVVYGGAHLFRADTAAKLGRLALRSLEEYAPDAGDLAGALGLLDSAVLDEAELRGLYDAVVERLRTQPVQDLRIDFEDGYGLRADAEEDGHAAAAAEATAEGMRAGSLPEFIGIRIKALGPETGARGIRTLDLYLSRLLDLTGGQLPEGFVITLPKVEHENQVGVLAEVCGAIEESWKMAPGSLQIEIMVETPRALFSSDGGAALPRLVTAARGRLRGAHFGAYDYTAACHISAELQDIRHPVCDFARWMMQASLASSEVWLSDSVTPVMPVPLHRGDQLTILQREENLRAVRAAWKTHYDNIRHSLENGFYQSWDLHPAQLPVRFAALRVFFRENLSASAARLRNFIERATQASLLGNQFDDAATAQGLLNFFAQALAAGAVTEREATTLTGLTVDELQARSFAKIMERNRGSQTVG